MTLMPRYIYVINVHQYHDILVSMIISMCSHTMSINANALLFHVRLRINLFSFYTDNDVVVNFLLTSFSLPSLINNLNGLSSSP